MPSDLIDKLSILFANQRLAALATQGGGQPHASLVAFAATEDLKHLIFVTPRSTRKFANLCENPFVAILIDNRLKNEEGFDDSFAATAVGEAVELKGPERQIEASVYLARHPDLADLVDAPDTALMRIKVGKYFVVSTIRDVVEIDMS